jgi:predicted nucleotidyltransferase
MSTQAMAQQIAEYFKTQPVLKAWIFGSYSRGEQNADSDVDILIVPDKMVGLFKLSGMMLDLQELLQKRVDLVTEKGLLPFARESVDRDKILIYERAA